LLSSSYFERINDDDDDKLTTLFDSIKFQLILGNMINFALIYCHCLEQFNSFV